MGHMVFAWFWLCCIAILTVQNGQPVHGETSISPEAESFQSDAPSAILENGVGSHEMSSKTREALVHLRALKQQSSRLSKVDRKSGIIGATAYYLKKGFILLFMNSPRQENSDGPDIPRPKLSKPLAKALNLLEDAAAEQDTDALFLLAEINFYGNFSHPRDYRRSFELYGKVASLNGNSTAQQMIGFMFATGIGNSVERDQAKALMYHTFAAKGGNTRAEMTVAYRHHSGIGTPRNCNEAVFYYKKVADKAIEFARSGPPGGLPLVRESYHIADDDGGVYGEGASFSSSGHNARRGGPGSDQNSPFDDVMEYLDLLSRKGDISIAFGLGRIHYDGSRTVRRNFRTARKYFIQVASQYWNKEGKIISENAAVGKTASKAAAYLGRFYLRGEGVPQNYDRALRWFKLGVANGNAYCQYEIGLMYLLGLGVNQDVVMASNYFKESAQQDWPAAQANLGKLFLDQGDLKTASAYFELALRHGHIEAFYHLAELNNFGVGRERSCDLASSYYKVVAEKAETLHSSFDEANQDYEEGDLSGALVKFMMAAEQGYEQAQANVAYLLDENKSILSLDWVLPWKQQGSTLLRNAALALVYWTRSSKQFNIDSTVKMGDYYLKGHGAEADVEKAAQCYQSAAEMQQSAQALWNLGWMYENGLGVEQDFHLANRLYEEAAEATPESYLPVKLSILKLRIRSYWNQLTDGKVNPIQPEPEPKRYRNWHEWLAHFLADESFAHPHDARQVDESQGSLGDGGDEYYLEDIEGGMLETVTMLALAAALAILVYYRQQRQQNHQRAIADQDQRQRPEAGTGQHGEDNDEPVLPGQQLDGGFFPPPEDPNFDAWRVGGVGH